MIDLATELRKGSDGETGKAQTQADLLRNRGIKMTQIYIYFFWSEPLDGWIFCFLI